MREGWIHPWPKVVVHAQRAIRINLGDAHNAAFRFRHAHEAVAKGAHPLCFGKHLPASHER
eukprot:6490413-Prymnesium_polylepis.2